MELSIIIVNYNTFELTKCCIRSLYQYIKNVEFEVILVDNASSDMDSSKFLEEFQDIILVSNSDNVGFAKGNNKGLEMAGGKYILLLNSDTEFIEFGFDKCLSNFFGDSSLGVLSCQLLYSNGTVQHCANDFPSIRIELIELLRLHKILRVFFKLNGFHFDHLSRRYVDWVWGTFFLFRREVLESFPEEKLPEDFFMYYEDVQWCHAIRKKGFDVLYYPDFKVLHHLSASANSSFIHQKKLKLLINNERTFLKKEFGLFYVFVLYQLRSIKMFSLRRREFFEVGSLYFKASLGRGL